VGNAGNISAYWMGYGEDLAAGNATRKPKMYGFQASGAAPIVQGAAVREPSTIATAIRIGNPASWTKAIDARDESGGLIAAVTDREILATYRMLAREVGVFVELGSAASVAGLLQQAALGTVPRGSTVVCTVTGHGLKDPEWAISTAPSPTTIKNDVLAAARALDLA
jgi:threonine synthase